MREWFTSLELMEIDGLPSTPQGLSQKAKRDDWKSRKASGRGRMLEYHISNFHDEVVAELRSKFGDEKISDNVTDVENKEIFYNSISIPFYDVYASAGYGLVPYEGQPSYMDIHPMALQDLNLSNTKDLFFMKVKGDSMEPALYEEDVVLVHKLHDIPRLLEGIFVVSVDGQLLIKHIQLNKFEEWITLSSLNESYKAYEIKGSDLEAVHIVGEVIRKFAKVRKVSSRTLESLNA